MADGGGVRAPGPYALTRAMSELAQARERLLAIDPTMDGDAQLLADMLDSETGDAMQIVERLIEASIEADTLADGAKARKADAAERQARFERRRDALRSVILRVLEALNLPRLERPGWTVSIRQIPAPLLVDEAALPDEWFRLERKPELALIRKELASGGDVEGCQFGNASTGLSVRTR